MTARVNLKLEGNPATDGLQDQMCDHSLLPVAGTNTLPRSSKFDISWVHLGCLKLDAHRPAQDSYPVGLVQGAIVFQPASIDRAVC